VFESLFNMTKPFPSSPPSFPPFWLGCVRSLATEVRFCSLDSFAPPCASLLRHNSTQKQPSAAVSTRGCRQVGPLSSPTSRCGRAGLKSPSRLRLECRLLEMARTPRIHLRPFIRSRHPCACTPETLATSSSYVARA
jgi:hypothetical protein